MQYQPRKRMVEQTYYDYAGEDPQNDPMHIGRFPVIAACAFGLGMLVVPFILYYAIFGG